VAPSRTRRIAPVRATRKRIASKLLGNRNTYNSNEKEVPS